MDPQSARDLVAADRKHVVVLGGLSRSLVDFRGPLIRRLLSRGYRVTAIAGNTDIEVGRTLTKWGAEYLSLPLARAGLNPFADLVTVARLARLFRRMNPDVFLGYTIKPVIYGLVAALLAGTRRRYVMISGLGYAFTDGRELKRRIVRLLGSAVYRSTLRLANRVIFQNPDDRQLFVARRFVRADRSVCVPGSGVDLTHYAPVRLPDGPITFLLVARLLKDKGIREFVAAAERVKAEFPEARFWLVGARDPNPSGLPPEEIEEWMIRGVVDYRGETRDIRPFMASCHVFVLPSYREGMPRTVLEAMAIGRAIITTDVAGCRETVVPGVNGYLVPPRDAASLAAAMTRFIADSDLCRTMGAASLEIAASRFEAGTVAAATMRAMDLSSPKIPIGLDHFDFFGITERSAGAK